MVRKACPRAGLRSYNRPARDRGGGATMKADAHPLPRRVGAAGRSHLRGRWNRDRGPALGAAPGAMGGCSRGPPLAPRPRGRSGTASAPARYRRRSPTPSSPPSPGPTSRASWSSFVRDASRWHKQTSAAVRPTSGDRRGRRRRLQGVPGADQGCGRAAVEGVHGVSHRPLASFVIVDGELEVGGPRFPPHATSLAPILKPDRRQRRDARRLHPDVPVPLAPAARCSLSDPFDETQHSSPPRLQRLIWHVKRTPTAAEPRRPARARSPSRRRP